MRVPIWIAKFAAALTLASALAAPLATAAQDYGSRHERAVRSQRHHDRRHHTGAKIVGGSAVGGAVVGGLLGGPKGAIIGAGVGAGGGAVANHVRVKRGVKKRERRDY
jgi:outer membrane lipoprotein SlyB